MLRFKLQIESSSNRFYFFFQTFFIYNFQLSSYTYFIHQDSTRCETCNILNPIFYIFIIEIKYNGFLYIFYLRITIYIYSILTQFELLKKIYDIFPIVAVCFSLSGGCFSFFIYFSLLLSRN